MKKVNTQEYKEIIKSGITLVDFFADWCGPCKMLGPIIEELDNEYPNIEFVKVNVDENMELAEEYGIMSIPTVYIIKDGNVVSAMQGYRDKSGVKAFIDNAIK